MRSDVLHLPEFIATALTNRSRNATIPSCVKAGGLFGLRSGATICINGREMLPRTPAQFSLSARLRQARPRNQSSAATVSARHRTLPRGPKRIGRTCFARRSARRVNHIVTMLASIHDLSGIPKHRIFLEPRLQRELRLPGPCPTSIAVSASVAAVHRDRQQ